jgi:predicted MPP superfamily phosphohydrolase
MLLAWATDVHFEFATVDDVVAFCEAAIALAPAGLLLTGDIGQATSVERYLRALDRALPFPTYFVLGNHDFYHGSIEDVRGAVRGVVAEGRHLTWMSDADVVELGPDVALVGHDGWADARCGDYASSKVLLNDYRLIRELAGLTAEARRSVLETLGDQAATHFARVLPAAFAKYRQVIALTHVPPFAETSWYRGRIADPDWLPHFCAKAVGDVFLEATAARPGRELLVLCGHTHAGGALQIRPNLRVIVGSAEYGRPQLQEPLHLDGEPTARAS